MVRRGVTLTHFCQLAEFADNLAFKVCSLVRMESGWYPIVDYEVVVQSFCYSPGSLVLGWNCVGELDVVSVLTRTFPVLPFDGSKVRKSMQSSSSG